MVIKGSQPPDLLSFSCHADSKPEAWWVSFEDEDHSSFLERLQWGFDDPVIYLETEEKRENIRKNSGGRKMALKAQKPSVLLWSSHCLEARWVNRKGSDRARPGSPECGLCDGNPSS